MELAIEKNPEYKVIYESPTQKAANRAKKIIEDEEIKNINIRVAQ